MIYLFQRYRVVAESLTNQEPNISLRPVVMSYLRSRRTTINEQSQEGRIMAVTPISDGVFSTTVGGVARAVTEIVLDVSAEAVSEDFAWSLMDGLLERNKGDNVVRIVSYEKESYNGL